MGDTQRLFFALWPDDETRSRIDVQSARLHRRYRGRRIPARNLHLTLAFLGDCGEAERRAAARAARGVAWRPFVWRLDRVGFFEQRRVRSGTKELALPRGIVWAGGEVDDDLATLVADLRAALSMEPVPLDAKRFVPHVSLLREASAANADEFLSSIMWPVSEFLLMASSRGEEGVRYRILSRFAARSR